MRKLLILISVIVSLFLAACSNDPVVSKLPFVYKLDIQQGNVITQNQVDQLRTGMSRRQVQFVIGAPMITDPFHANRWDYFYSLQPGSGRKESAKEQLTLIFLEDNLSEIRSSLSADKEANQTQDEQITVDVPYQEPETIGVLTRLWRWLTFQNKEPT